ncbi:hypothetical protein Pst134EB_028309 [Puccinia striiformis f. sp. tritici]|nr:hypothetical protein Pst134EB_028309 [Puccinia striiformis f. sp. tritici]
MASSTRWRVPSTRRRVPRAPRGYPPTGSGCGPGIYFSGEKQDIPGYLPACTRLLAFFIRLGDGGECELNPCRTWSTPHPSLLPPFIRHSSPLPSATPPQPTDQPLSPSIMGSSRKRRRHNTSAIQSPPSSPQIPLPEDKTQPETQESHRSTPSGTSPQLDYPSSPMRRSY